MKNHHLTLIAVTMLASSLHHAEAQATRREPRWVLPEITDGVADLTNYDQNEFIALKFLSRIQSGMKPTKTDYLPIITEEGIQNARLYLLKKRFDFPGNDEFKQRRANEKLDAILKSGGEPFRTIDAVTHIRIDLTRYVIKNYDFEKSAYPFRPEPRGFAADLSLYDESQPFGIDVIRIDYLPIDAELAESWKKTNGRLTGLFRLGKGFSGRKGFPAQRAVCEKLEFRTREGELLAEIPGLPVLRNPDKDLTIEEMTNADHLKGDVPEGQPADNGGSSSIPAIMITVVALIGGGWIIRRYRSNRSA
jgi:hypothetical protein